jgi:hypothetical protein
MSNLPHSPEERIPWVLDIIQGNPPILFSSRTIDEILNDSRNTILPMFGFSPVKGFPSPDTSDFVDLINSPEFLRLCRISTLPPPTSGPEVDEKLLCVRRDSPVWLWNTDDLKELILSSENFTCIPQSEVEMSHEYIQIVIASLIHTHYFGQECVLVRDITNCPTAPDLMTKKSVLVTGHINDSDYVSLDSRSCRIQPHLGQVIEIATQREMNEVLYEMREYTRISRAPYKPSKLHAVRMEEPSGSYHLAIPENIKITGSRDHRMELVDLASTEILNPRWTPVENIDLDSLDSWSRAALANAFQPKEVVRYVHRKSY